MTESAHLVRVLVVDDQPWVRVGLRTLLDLEDGFEVVGVLERGEDALAWLDDRPRGADVVLLDVRMPGIGGIETARRLAQRSLGVGVLLLTTFEEEDDMVAGLQSGAAGYLLKDVSVETLVMAVRRVASGERYIQPRVSEALAEALQRKQRSESAPAERLTGREREVLALVASGLSNKRIAQALKLTEGTIKVHVSSILSKLQVQDRLGAVRRGVALGLLEEP